MYQIRHFGVRLKKKDRIRVSLCRSSLILVSHWYGSSIQYFRDDYFDEAYGRNMWHALDTRENVTKLWSQPFRKENSRFRDIRIVRTIKSLC
jgi:hypothetical protein